MQLIEKHLNRFRNNMTPSKIFIFLLILLEGVAFIRIAATQGNALGDLLFYDRDDFMMDLFHPILGYETISPSNLYTDANVFYPPLAMLIFYVLYLLIPKEIVFQSPYEARSEQYTLFLAILGVILISVLIVFILMQLRNGASTQKKMFAISALLSYPMLYQLDRGNIIILAFLFTLLFLLWMDSESRIKRELALIALAIAFGLKGYPALFGLILLSQRRWKESIRCALYGLAAFILPALFFRGVDLLEIIRAFGNMSDTVVAEGFGYKVNFSNTIHYLISSMEMEAISRSLFDSLCLVLGLLCLLAALVPGALWKKLCLISIFIAGVPGVSYAYVMIFFLIPAVVFLNETDKMGKHSWSDYVYAILLVACLAPLPFSGVEYMTELRYPMTFTVLTESIAIFGLAFALLADRVVAVCSMLRCRRTAVSESVNKN